MESDELNIKISKFRGSLKVARRLELHMIEELQGTKDMERLVKAKLKDTVIHQSNVIAINFLNKKFKLSIESVLQTSDAEDIADRLAQIQISVDQFYIVDSRCAINITSNKESLQETNQKLESSLEQIGGIDEIIQDLRRTMDLALGIEECAGRMKISRAVIVQGISGCGKTLLCQALAQSYPKAHKIFIDSWKIFSKFYGESETNLMKHFEEACVLYPKPTIIVIDEISNICPKNDTSDAVRRVSTLLASLLDGLHIKRNASKIFVLTNTNNLENVDPAIRRSGRLDLEVEIPVPTADVREKILTKMLSSYDLSLSEIHEIAKHTHGFVGADLENLISKASQVVMMNEKHSLTLTYASIMEHLWIVKPSAIRELLIEKPNVKWSDIGGSKDLKLKLKQMIEWPLNHPETFERLGIKPLRGLLMFGAPGCSKTMIAKALASESNLNFISIKGSDLFSMWVGESEKAVRNLFVKARQLSPCIIFFDEIDAIGGERSAESGSSVKERVLAQILTEIDGINTLKNVIIIAATNRPDLIDKALMRPGRLDRIVYVKLPDAETRHEIFTIKLAKIPCADDVNINKLVDRTEGYSGAEIEALCKEAALKALEDSFEVQEISALYFEKALDIVKPRTSPELLQLYSDYEKQQ